MSRSSFAALWIAVSALGVLFAWRLTQIPSRLETAAFLIALCVAPTLKYPRFGAFYLLLVPLFIPVLRRAYYLVSERPTLDALMLVGDGVMGGFVAARVLTAVLRKEKVGDALTWWVLLYVAVLFLKVFFRDGGSIQEGLYGFKFNGLFVLFYFAGSAVLSDSASRRRAMQISAWALAVTALYGIKQFLLGFAEFEQRWMDSITFTTLYIEGVVRPFSTYVSPAAMSDGMCILMLLGCVSLTRGGLGNKFAGLLFLTLGAVPLLLATVRTSWAAMAAGLIFFWLFLRVRRTWLRWALFAFALGGALMAVNRSDSTAESQHAAFSQDLRGGERKASSVLITSRTQALKNPLQEYSVQRRLEIWTEIAFMSLHHPLGRGQGTHGYAHSYYFQLLGETGYPGLVLFLSILFLGFRRGFEVIRLAPDSEAAEQARWGMSLLFVFSILNLTGTHLHSNPGDVFFWFTVGMLTRLRAEARDRAATAPEPSEAAVPALTNRAGHG